MRYFALIAALFCCAAVAQADDAPKPEKASVAELNAATEALEAEVLCCPTCRPTPVRDLVAKVKARLCQPKCCPPCPCPEPKPEPEPCCEPAPVCCPGPLQRLVARIKARRCCPPPCCE